MLRGLHPQSNRAPGTVLHILSSVDQERLLAAQEAPQQRAVYLRPATTGLLPGLEALRQRVAAREEEASGG